MWWLWGEGWEDIGYLNMQLLFSDSSLCNQLSDGRGLISRADSWEGITRKQKLPELGWPEKAHLSRYSDLFPCDQKGNMLPCEQSRGVGAGIMTVWPLAINMDWELHS